MKFSEFLKEQSTDKLSGLHDAIMEFIKKESGSNKVHSLVNTKNLYSEITDTYFGVYTELITIKGSYHAKMTTTMMKNTTIHMQQYIQLN